jgi:acyl-CoA dehydrogenase
LRDRSRIHQLVGLEILQRLGAAALFNAVADKRSVNARIDDQMRDVDILRTELASHALRDRAKSELGARKCCIANAATHTCGGAGEEDAAFAVRQHQACGFAAAQEPGIAGQLPDLAEDTLSRLQQRKVDVGADIEDADLEWSICIGSAKERRYIVLLARIEAASHDLAASRFNVGDQRLKLVGIATAGKNCKALGREFFSDRGANEITRTDNGHSRVSLRQLPSPAWPKLWLLFFLGILRHPPGLHNGRANEPACQATCQVLRFPSPWPQRRHSQLRRHGCRRRNIGVQRAVPEEREHIVADTAARILADLADPQIINKATNGAWKEPLWLALSDAGLPLAWVPEELGGSGAGLADGFAILGVAGRFALSVPLAETLAAGWLLAHAGLEAPKTPMTLAPARPHDRITVDAEGKLNGRATGVPFARDVPQIAVLTEDGRQKIIALVNTKDCRVGEGRNLAGDAISVVAFDRVKPRVSAPAPNGFDQSSLMLMGSTIRSVETAGALEAILSLSVAYANERVAFERPIGKFQAVQQNLARLAGEVAAALAVSGSAADTIIQAKIFDEAVFFEAASAKIRTAEAATEGAAIAHQVLGAIGFTQEHILHRFTLRMLSWRDDFGNESYWAAELGKHVARRGVDEFWPMVASR